MKIATGAGKTEIPDKGLGWDVQNGNPGKEVAREFLAGLSAEEDKLIARMQLDETGAGLITAIKEFDHYYYNLVRHERSEETDHHFHIMQLGLPRLIAGILVKIPRFRYPVITFGPSGICVGRKAPG